MLRLVSVIIKVCMYIKIDIFIPNGKKKKKSLLINIVWELKETKG